MLKLKKRYKPFYKQFLKIRKNIQNRTKLFKFKKKKWEKLQYYSKRQLKFFKKSRIRDQFILTVSRYTGQGNSYKKSFRNNLQDRKTFNLFYGGLKKHYIKKQIYEIKNKKPFKKEYQNFKQNALKFFESRLDTVLYRVKFSFSIKNARQLIKHGHILVNGLTVRSKSYILKSNDLIEIAYNVKSRFLIQKNIFNANFWPIPPKHLLVNYITCQILFLAPKNNYFFPLLNHYLNITSIINNIRKY